jgi:hypothetical protein
VSASTAATYIFTAPTCTTTIITLEPCALNAEFQHFILRFNKISLLLPIPLKEGIGGEREGDFTGNFNAAWIFNSEKSDTEVIKRIIKSQLYSKHYYYSACDEMVHILCWGSVQYSRKISDRPMNVTHY